MKPLQASHDVWTVLKIFFSFFSAGFLALYCVDTKFHVLRINSDNRCKQQTKGEMEGSA